MKRLLFMLFVLFIMALPTLAQDATAEVTVEANPFEIIPTTVPAPAEEGNGNNTVINVGTPVNEGGNAEDYVTEFLIGIALLAVVVFGSFAIYLVSQLVPAGIAKELVETGVRAGFQMALNRAETTTTDIDDRVYTALAGIPGLEVSKDINGHYVVKSRPQPGTAPTPPTTPLG